MPTKQSLRKHTGNKKMLLSFQNIFGSKKDNFFPLLFQAEDVALCNAARERHVEVMDFLLTKKVNHERLLNNRKVRLITSQETQHALLRPDGRKQERMRGENTLPSPMVVFSIYFRDGAY